MPHIRSGRKALSGSSSDARALKRGDRALRSRGFTLLELLTVMAITAIMMTIIIVPVIQSFNLLRAGQGFSDAQNKAAQLVEKIGREITQAAAVRDNAGSRGMIAVYVPRRDRYIPPGGGYTLADLARILVPFGKLDLLMPAQGEPIRGPSGALINPVTGKEDPTLRAPKGQVVLPVSQGSTLVRYFIGRRNPFQSYNNPYDGLLMQRNAAQDNLYVLYRAEVQPWIYSRNLGRFVVNKALFYDLNRDASATTSGPLFDDPDFFDPLIPVPAYSNPDPDPVMPDPTKAQMVQNWIDHATVVTEISRYDMLQVIFNKANRQVQFLADDPATPIDESLIPRLYSLVQFRPTSMNDEPADALTAVRLSEEGEGMANFGPDVFRTKMGAWSNILVRLWPNQWAVGNPYETLRSDPNGVAPGLSVYLFDPAGGAPDTTGGTELFDADEYSRSVRDGLIYPFSRGVTEANARSAWITNTALRSAFTPFFSEAGVGKLIGSFPVSEYGTTPIVDNAAPFPNMNVQHMNTGPALTPTNDTNLPGTIADPMYAPSNGGGPWQSGNSGSMINKNFNKMWIDHPELRPNIHRFIDLRVGKMRDGSPSLLNPDPSLGFARTRIVPGSEVVIGPDQNPGPNYGRLIRYTRTTRQPGPNQYRINYTDLQEPTNPAGPPGNIDYSQIGLPNPPAVYDPTNYVSAEIQPRYKAGYIQFNSDPNVPLPGDDDPNTPAFEPNISVSYRFQMTGAGDTVAVDYDTGQLLQVLLTVKNFPQTTLPNAQSITLKATASARNILR